jgi:hypothetical protein
MPAMASAATGCEPGRPGGALLARAGTGAIGHQGRDIGAAQGAREPVAQACAQADIGRGGRDVHAHIDADLRHLAIRCGADEGAAADRAVDQSAAAGLGIGAGDGGQIHAERGRQCAVRRQPVAGGERAAIHRRTYGVGDGEITWARRGLRVGDPVANGLAQSHAAMMQAGRV